MLGFFTRPKRHNGPTRVSIRHVPQAHLDLVSAAFSPFGFRHLPTGVGDVRRSKDDWILMTHDPSLKAGPTLTRNKALGKQQSWSSPPLKPRVPMGQSSKEVVGIEVPENSNAFILKSLMDSSTSLLTKPPWSLAKLGRLMFSVLFP